MVKSRIITFFVILILFLTAFGSVYAITESIVVSGWVKHESTFTSTHNTYFVESMNPDVYDLESNYLKITRNGKEYKLVNFRNCVKEKYYEYCFINSTLDSTLAGWDSYKRYHPALNITITEFFYPNEVVIKKTLNKEQISIGEVVDVKVIYQNIYNYDFINFQVTEIIPANFEIVNYSSNWLEMNGELKIKTILNKNTQKEFTYKLKALKEGTYNLKSEVIYDANNSFDINLESMKSVKVIKNVITQPVNNVLEDFEEPEYLDEEDIFQEQPPEYVEEPIDDYEDVLNEAIQEEKEAVTEEKKEKELKDMNFFEKFVYFIVTLF
jgi:uncharacterized repeat protein (TIGR01451 family)